MTWGKNESSLFNGKKNREKFAQWSKTNPLAAAHRECLSKPQAEKCAIQARIDAALEAEKRREMRELAELERQSQEDEDV